MRLAGSNAERSVKIEQLARAIEARVVVPSGRGNPDINRIYAGATMSDLIANAGPGTLLVTSLANNQLIRVAELMDVPGICLVDGSEPAADLVSQARSAGTGLLVSRQSGESTCKRAAACLTGKKAPSP